MENTGILTDDSPPRVDLRLRVGLINPPGQLSVPCTAVVNSL
jgi:hypothetical protein